MGLIADRMKMQLSALKVKMDSVSTEEMVLVSDVGKALSDLEQEINSNPMEEN
jgi:hypothetical protein